MSEERKNTARVRFNLLDVVVLLLVVLCIVGVWQRDNLQDLFEDDTVTADYVVNFEIAALREADMEYLVKNTAVYICTEQGNVGIGTLYGSVHSSDLSLSASGNAENAEDSEPLKAVSGSILCRLMERDGRYFVVEGTELAVNCTFKARTEIVDFEIKVTGISKIN